jgi:WD40 repeat protein
MQLITTTFSYLTDFCVKLWNLDALLSSPTNVKEALLATLSSHTKSVNIVRWSRDGKLIASGSDDNYILVHKYTPGALSNQSFGSNNSAAKNKETWSRYTDHIANGASTNE